MKSSKNDQSKSKSKSKTPCSSKQASQFLEKEGFNNFSLNFKGLAVSLSDFVPNPNNEITDKSELDFDIGKQMKKLEKKDSGTKQKALLELIDMINNKDNECIVGMLRYWPKIYNKLSTDEDKRVRELNQDLMSDLAKLSGKNLGVHIKHLLPTWIFSQSDIHGPVALLATKSFRETFPDDVRRQKAFLLCWDDISTMISTSINRVPIKEKNPSALKENSDEISTDDASSNMKIKKRNSKEKADNSLPITEQPMPVINNADVYVDDLVLHLRTLITILPYIEQGSPAADDVSKWINSKHFWAHYTVSAPTNIVAIYLTLSTVLLTHAPYLVVDVPFVVSHLSQMLRLVDHYHSVIVPLAWTAIIKCADTFGQRLWQHVSFPNTFLPKWLKMLECGADGRVSLACSFMLPFFTKIPLDIALADSTHIFLRIFEAMDKGLSCSRIRHNGHEANCLVTTIFECATYTILGARAASNDSLRTKVLSFVWNIVERYLTDIEYNKVDRTIAQFCHVSLRPLVNKGVLSSTEVKEVLLLWIDKYHDNGAVFSDHFSAMVTEVSNVKVNEGQFCTEVMEAMQMVLLQRVVDEDQHWLLLPYLSAICTQIIAPLACDHEARLRRVFILSTSVILPSNQSLAHTISLALANILTNIPNDATSIYQQFLAALSRHQYVAFFTHFYNDFVGQLNATIADPVASVTLHSWQSALSRDLGTILCPGEDKIDVEETLSQVFIHCAHCTLHGPHLSQIIAVVDQFISRAIDAVTVTDGAIESLLSLAKYVIDQANVHSAMDLVPRSIALNLIKMRLSLTADTTTDLTHVIRYLNHSNGDCDIAIIDQILQEDHCHLDIAVALLSIVIVHSSAVNHVDQMLRQEMVHLDQIMDRQRRYSLSIVHQQQPSLCLLMHKLHVLINLPLDTNGSLVTLKSTVDQCAVLITPILFSTFPNCHYSSHILQQCESIYTRATRVMAPPHGSALITAMVHCTHTSNIAIFDQCFTLTLLALNHFMPANHTQWPAHVRSSVDIALAEWTDCGLLSRQSSLVFEVLVPCAVKARYIVQEMILATIASFLDDDLNPTLHHINRAILLIKSLTLADAAYFEVCYPLLISVKHRFQPHIDQLHDVNLRSTSTQFDLSSLLEILIAAVDSSLALTRGQWDFILCLVSTLSRSKQFIDSGDFSAVSVCDDIDHLLNSVLLLRLIASIAVSLASITNESILDEWDNFFSEPIFTTVLDLFSLVSGDHSQPSMVISHQFAWYRESLAETVSLCPVPVLLAHQFQSQIHVNDPVNLPKHLLLVLNSLLASLSSRSLAVQLAAYNCLLNLADHLSGLLLEQISQAESSDSLQSSAITLPFRLLSYLRCDHLLATDQSQTDQSNINQSDNDQSIISQSDNDQSIISQSDNDILLTRCFLAWSLLLHLFSCSQPKVRAEISSFLVSHDRLLDNFLSFCYALMPKNPAVTKRHLTFLTVQDRHSVNLIAEEPQILSQCIDRRTKFTVYHLSSFLFRRSVQVLPNLARQWFLALDLSSQHQVDLYVRQFITPELSRLEFDQLKRNVGTDDRLEIQALPVIGEVTVRYVVPGDQCLEQIISVPSNYPLGKVTLHFKKEMTVKIPHWKSWIIQMTSTMHNQNGSIIDGVRLWKKNLDNHFDGVEECMICYSILHAQKYTLPSMKCRQCKKKFHKDCMYKWFQSSTNPTCPNCRNVFYDGTYKRAQYGDLDG